VRASVIERLVEAVQSRRVVDEDLFSCALVQRKYREQIDEIAVVWRMPRRKIVRVRPIAAPDNTLRRRRDHRRRVRDHLDKRQTEVAVDFSIANLVGAADFYPDMFQFDEIEQ